MINKEIEVPSSGEAPNTDIVKDKDPNLSIPDIPTESPKRDEEVKEEQAKGINGSQNPDEPHFSLFSTAEQYYTYFENTEMGMVDAMELLIQANTMVSIYVLVQIFGNPNLMHRFYWRDPHEDDIKYLNKYLKNPKTYKLFSIIYPQLDSVLRNHMLFKKVFGKIKVENLTLEDFSSSFETYLKKLESAEPDANHQITPKPKKKKKKKTPQNSNKQKNRHSSNKVIYLSYRSQSNNDDRKLYSDFEYGLSDW